MRLARHATEIGRPLGALCPRRSRMPWDLRRVVHLHRRAGFAATWDELQRDLKDGPEASIDRLLEGKVPIPRRPRRISPRSPTAWPTWRWPRPSPVASRAGGSTACSSARTR